MERKCIKCKLKKNTREFTQVNTCKDCKTKAMTQKRNKRYRDKIKLIDKRKEAYVLCRQQKLINLLKEKR
jgi:predicted DNA-binding WGR domain protein